MNVSDFKHKSFGYCKENALFLAQCARVVYDDLSSEGNVRRQVGEWGCDMDRFRIFDRGDTQAFLIADDHKLIICFRGTEPAIIQDWVSDAKIRKTHGAGGDVHRGFSQALHDVWADVEDTIDDERNRMVRANLRPQLIWITGHSLGAALATLAAANLHFSDSPTRVTGLYTFGQPRTGSERWADHFNASLGRRTFRFVNNNDIVPRVPPSALDYGHVGSLRYFTRDGELRRDPELTWWSRFWDRLEGRLEDFLDDPLDGVTDHDMSNYVQLIEASDTPN